MKRFQIIFAVSMLVASLPATASGPIVTEQVDSLRSVSGERTDTVAVVSFSTEVRGEVGDDEEAGESDADSTSDFPRIPTQEYLYAGGPRHTLTGNTPYIDTHIEPVPFAITAGAVTALVAGIHIYQQNAWWSDNRGDFYFNTAWDYAAQADKFGHMFAGYFSSYISYEALVASGMGKGTASWLGPTIALGFMTYVEVEDGFAADWGFDPTDQYANILGTALFAGQQYFPWLQNVKMKWSYWPTDDLNTGTGPGHNTIVVDDYNGQAAWMTFTMGNILPESIGWPKWLQLGVGYGAYNVNNWDDQGRLLPAGRRILFALDYNLVEAVPDIGTVGNWLVQTLDYIHLPAPAIQVTPDVKFFILYPIEF